MFCIEEFMNFQQSTCTFKSAIFTAYGNFSLDRTMNLCEDKHLSNSHKISSHK